MIRADWFSLLPDRTWQTWFWVRVKKELRKKNIKGTDFVKVKKIAVVLDKEIKKKVNALSQ